MRNFVESLAADAKIGRHLAFRGLHPGGEAVLGSPAAGLPAGAAAAMRELGIDALYSHQAEAVDQATAGRNVLLATPTASGKTLAYLLAFLARRQANPAANAIFLYPLKALARDQLKVIRAVLGALDVKPEDAAEVYDGDTPDAQRRRIRRAPPAVILTNPDMLHLGILPSHETWAPFFEQLALVAVDEAHVYRGIFGAHVHHVLRRLLRLARAHGASPALVAGSATIGAPGEFIERLTGEPFHVIRQSGAPTAPRHVLFLSPGTASPYTVATRVVAAAVAAGHKTIAFTKARRITELMHRWLREMNPDLAPRVASYRAGYLPEERREIESRLFSGSLDGVISTSALESGIDVGGLDVAVLVGYPGSLATAWQRIGRAGRGRGESLSVLVAMPDALDRYVVRHPEHFFSGEFERVVLDPDNDTVADVHLQSAAAERSIDASDLTMLCGPGGGARAARLENDGRLTRVHEEERWFSARRRPQRDISLRNSGTGYTLLRASDGRTLGTLDEGRAWFEGHPGAIYLHAGRTYRVLELSREERTIRLEPGEFGYYTQVYARKETEILERTDERPLGPATLAHGRLRVTTFIEGFGKRRITTQEELSRHPLDAPPLVLETTGFWIEFPKPLVAALVAEERHPAGSLHALEHAAIGLFPLLAICDRWDLGGISYASHPQMDRPAVFIYDGWPGGVGLAGTGYQRAEELLEKTRELVAGCPCEDGCPSCVHSPKCGSGNTPLDKAGAVEVLEMLAGMRAIPDADLRAGEEDLARALATHRTGTHSGVRGGAPLPREFFGVEEQARQASRPASGEEDVEHAVSLDGRWPADLPGPADLLAAGERHWLAFDLETIRSADEVGGWGNIARMGLALGVVLDLRLGVLRTYFEKDVERLVEDLLAADMVIGFNHERFDLAVLSGYVGDRVRGMRTLDLLAHVKSRLGFRLGLGHLAKETLHATKSADGLQSLEWVRQGRLDLVERYCRDDVVITAALWGHGRHHRYVLFRNREGLVGRIPVDW